MSRASCARTCLLWVSTLCAPACGGGEQTSGDDASPTRGAAAAAGRSCGVGTHTALTGDGIGDLRVGASVDEVGRSCRVLRDTSALGVEGMHERRILVDLGRDSVSAVVDSGRVWRIHVERPAFRTADSLGVDTPAAVLKRSGAQVLIGEGTVFLRLASHCGLSFRLRGVPPSRASSPAQIPDEARVDEVLAVGCAGDRAPPTSP